MKNISPQEARMFLESDKQAVLIDVRTKEEVRGISVPEAINIPLDSLPEKLAQFERFIPVVFICRSGNRSFHAAAYAQSLGFTHVFNVVGGIERWDSE